MRNGFKVRQNYVPKKLKPISYGFIYIRSFSWMISGSDLIYLHDDPGMQNPNHNPKSAQDSKVVVLACGSSSSAMSYTGAFL